MIKYTNNLVKLNNNKALHQISLKIYNTFNFRFVVNDTKLLDCTKCYKILRINDNADQETVRRAFIELCKIYHPDSGNSSADTLKFHEVEEAYRLLQNKFAKEKHVHEGLGEYGLYYDEKKVKETEAKPIIFDIQHTAPQHRQYLSFDGVGSGTPFQRQKLYEKYRKIVAVDNVYNHHIKKLTEKDLKNQNVVIRDVTEANKIKTRYGIDRLVEDLIQESMSKGKFDNLKGQGKPLPISTSNPYIDFVTHKMNQVLINNGFTPEWINLQKEIDSDINSLKETLINERKKLGPLPLDNYEQCHWKKTIEALGATVQKLNQKINKFNLIVPILNRQKLLYNLQKESNIILENGVFSQNHLCKMRSSNKE